MVSSARSIVDRVSDAPTEDNIVLLDDMTWADYLLLLERRGDRSAPRMAYSEGTIELMSPSRSHESIKSKIGRLVEVWCLHHRVEFTTVGAWLLKSDPKEKGLEPDECYIFGEADSEVPHLAIEVIWTSGRMNKLDIYAALGVRELWIWRLGRVSVHALREGGYAPIEASEALPGIDLAQLASFLDLERTSEAIRAYRAALEA